MKGMKRLLISNRILRKIVAIQMMIVLLLSTLLVGSGSSSIKTVNAYRVAHSPSNPRDTAWASIPATTLQLGADDLAGGHGRPNLAQTSNITVKAAYNETDLFMLLKWFDPDIDNIHSYWEFKDGAWVKHEAEVNHDRLYVAWAITDSIGKGGETFANKGCAMSCHKFNTSNNNFVAMPEGQDQLNRCGACHNNSGIKLQGYKHTTNEGDGTCSAVACHSGQDRSFNNQAIVDGSPVTVGADHILPDIDGKLDIWHWKASNGANGYMDDQVVKDGKKRTNDGSSAIDFHNRNASSNPTHPLKVWPLGEERPLDYVATKRDYTNLMVALDAADPTRLADGITPVPEGTVVRMHMTNNLDATTTNLDIKSQFRRVNGYYEMVLKRKLANGDPYDYQFTNLNADHLFSIAAIDQGDINHAGSALQKLRFIPDTKAPVASMIAPAISSDISTASNFNLRWSGNDSILGSGVNNFDVFYRKAGNSLWSNWKSMTESTGSVFGLSSQPLLVKPGNVFEFKVRARDDAGNVGWSTIKKTVVPFDHSVLSYHGNWSNQNSPNHYKGSVKSTSTKDSFATGKLTGKTLTLIGPKGPNMGKLKLYIDGTRIITIDQYAPKAKFRQKLFTKSWSKLASHKIVVEAAGLKNTASSGKKISIDGIAVSK